MNTPLFEYHTATGELFVYSPAGLVIARLSMLDLAQVEHAIKGAALHMATGGNVPPVLRFAAPAPVETSPLTVTK